jgi:hypothetical protein
MIPRKYGPTFRFGKFTGRTAAEVAEIDAGYLRWALENMEYLSPQMRTSIGDVLERKTRRQAEARAFAKRKQRQAMQEAQRRLQCLKAGKKTISREQEEIQRMGMKHVRERLEAKG